MKEQIWPPGPNTLTEAQMVARHAAALVHLAQHPPEDSAGLLLRILVGDSETACTLAKMLQIAGKTDITRIDDAISLLLPLAVHGDVACSHALIHALGHKATLLSEPAQLTGPEAAAWLDFAMVRADWRRKLLQPRAGSSDEEATERPPSASGRQGMHSARISVCAAIPLSGDAATDMRLGRLTALHDGIDLLPAPDPADVEAKLLAKMPGMRPVIERICDELWLRRRSGSHVFGLRPILLTGPPGIGKTYFAEVLAEVMGIPLQSFSAGGNTDSRTLLGTARGYSSGQPCLPVLAMAQARAANVMLQVDEIDKTSDDRRNGSTKEALLSFLETTSARRYFDEFVQVEVDLSHIVWILTANSTHDLPATLLSRLMVIELQPPAPKAFDSLLSGVRTQLARELGVPAAGLPDLSMGQLQMLRTSLERHRSIRLLQMTVRRMLAVNARAIVLH